MIRALALSVLLSGCFTEVDLVLEDYTDWFSITTIGEAPGHSDSFRVIYANDEARSYSGLGQYPNGTIIVKEIYRRDGDQMGDFRYLGIMRKLSEAPAGVELDNGWLFTYRGSLDGGRRAAPAALLANLPSKRAVRGHVPRLVRSDAGSSSRRWRRRQLISSGG